MIIPDANLLIYAHNRSSAQHLIARKWWEAVLSGPEQVGIPWVVILAFVRLMTNVSINENPMSVDQAGQIVRGWLTQPNCRVLSCGSRTLDLFLELLENIGIGGNFSTDALIAAVAMEFGGTVYSNDNDFNRFPGILWENPIK